MTIEKAIQIGDKTHIHAQSITLHNFNTINAIVNSPVNPIPELEDDGEDFSII